MREAEIVSLFILLSSSFVWLFLSMPLSKIFLSSAVLAFLLFVVDLVVWRMAKADGELENDAFQILIREDEVESIKYGRSVIVLKAEEIKDMKLSPAKGGMIKIRPKDYSRLVSSGKIRTESAPQSGSSPKWLGLAIPQLKREERKELKAAIRSFRERNNIV